mmetsp:Transcript_50209/g.60586  ORF Transcript_50209/g.60586 Transcript_50209/m.60586 type:complete len:456 (+) Transcript_50209:161-1528(+)
MTTHDRALPLPKFRSVPAEFPADAMAAYSDHWVSNVHSRVGFLETLHDTLGLTPKVDFNAGVVAAGEAQIESTVTGNAVPEQRDVGEGDAMAMGREEVLKDQRQVFLPINNALSEVGHVHGFLQEIGQGIQHVASRVDDLIGFVQRGNDYRKITGEGFTFLNIPRSYYGVLSLSSLPCSLSPSTSQTILTACENFILTPDGAVPLHLTRRDVERQLQESLGVNSIANNELVDHKEDILDAIMKSRYENMYTLLGDHLTEEQYMGIVRNQILVDVQGDDLLFQIFTSPILQQNANDEAPFFEFIQRVCSSSSPNERQKMKPGCGGFGIRNFLTLFLSIEVSKAMHNLAAAKKQQNPPNERDVAFFSRMVELFTSQLNESNPILTEISNAMTDEGEAEEKIAESGEGVEMSIWKDRMDGARRRKEQGNSDLMRCSEKYKLKMRALRKEREAELCKGS